VIIRFEGMCMDPNSLAASITASETYVIGDLRNKPDLIHPIGQPADQRRRYISIHTQLNA
jgi:hypothetical protein